METNEQMLEQFKAAVMRKTLGWMLGFVAGAGVLMLTMAFNLGGSIDANTRQISQAQDDATYAKSLAMSDHESVIRMANDLDWIKRRLGWRESGTLPEKFDAKGWK